MNKKALSDSDAREIILADLNKNLLVEAGAGSGKTTMLVERIVRLLKKKEMTIGQLAAVTFTKKAAAEMRERLQIRLEKEVQASPTDALAVALTNLDQAYVGTIHSFCARLLRSRPVEAGVDPAFEEVEGADEALLLDKAWNEYLLTQEVVTSGILDRMREIGISLTQLKENYLEIVNYPDVEFPYESVPLPDTRHWKDEFIAVIKAAVAAMPKEIPEGGWDTIQQKLRSIDQLLKYQGIQQDKEFFDLLQKLDIEIKVTLNRWPSKVIAKEIQAKLEALKKDVVQPALSAWRQFRYGICMSFLSAAAQYCHDKRLKESKLNFQDLLMLTARMLRTHSEVRRFFAKRYTKIFVDEFQDTDPIQAEIVFFLTGTNFFETDWRRVCPMPGSLFIVGDPKQSIYRFRRSDIDIYNEVKGLITKTGGEVVELTSNFRSTGLIAEKVNSVFSTIFPPCGSNAQAPFAELVAERECTKTKHQGVKKISVGGKNNLSIAEADAEKVASFIGTSIGGDLVISRDGGRSTTATPGDFLILLYQTRDIDVYAKSLEKRNIPYEISGGGSFSTSEYLRSLCDLLQCLSDLTDPILLFKTLRGLFFGISDEQFYRFKKAGNYLSVFVAREDRTDAEAYEDLISSLESIRMFWKWTQDLPPAAAIEKICDHLGVQAFAASGELAGSSSGNIAKACELIRASSSTTSSFSETVGYLCQQLESEKIEEFSVTADRSDAVRLMNLHKAKGLEAPVVFLANPSKYKLHAPSFRVERSGAKAIGYIEIRIPNGEYHRHLAACPLNWQKHQATEALYLNAEKERLLYVAATRAKDLLVISTHDEKPQDSPWSPILKGMKDVSELEVPIGEGTSRINVHASTAGEVSKFTEEMHRVRNIISTKSYEVASVTSLSHKGIPMPTWIDSGNGMSWGTAVHRTLELCKSHTPDDLDIIVKNILDEEGISTDRSCEIIGIVSTVTSSALWTRMKRAGLSMAEVPFVHKDNGSGAWSGYPTLPIVISGVIDLLFKEDDGWVVVDYKTDTVAEDMAPWVNFYQPQLEMYAKQWEEATGERVKEKILYFVTNNKIVAW